MSRKSPNVFDRFDLYEEIELGERLYIAIFFEGSIDSPSTSDFVGLDFFSDDMGYEHNERDDIADLGRGQSLIIFDGIAQVQTIVRVK